MLTTKPTLDGHKLRQERERRNWRTEFVAYQIGVSNASIGHWERGFRTPGADNLAALCQLFGISIDEMFV